MRLTLRIVSLPLLILIASGCGGNPAGPSAGNSGGTSMFDGQTMQFGSGSSAFPRPPNPAWPDGLLDLNLYNCGRPPSFTIAVYHRSPSPNRYELGGELRLEASLQSPTEAAWQAGANVAGSSGSLTVSSASATRISGSFAFTLVQRGTGLTKNIAGTFDLEITSVDVCR